MVRNDVLFAHINFSSGRGFHLARLVRWNKTVYGLSRQITLEDRAIQTIKASSVIWAGILEFDLLILEKRKMVEKDL